MSPQHIFVAREQELARLNSILDDVLAGNGQICFISGDAGTGKTALCDEFARRSQDRNSELVVAIGQSDAQTGAGDAYLPFRELLAQLTGDAEASPHLGSMTEENVSRLKKFVGSSGQALVELGPDLIGIFLPGAGLATRAATYVAEKVGWLDKLEKLTSKSIEGAAPLSPGIDQSHIFEQYTNVLVNLAEKQPLMIIMDDLQWADEASISLLFRLGRRISGSRIMLIGTLRPAEVAMGREGLRHPLEKVQKEFKRYFGDIEINLNKTGEEDGLHFIQTFLQTEANGLGEAFRQALYNHTNGHPLFTIELLRAMQERGAIIQDSQGRWVENETLDWETLPARVEGVIEERIGRLEDELKEALTIASVEGELFTAEVVAQVQSVQARDLVRQMSGILEKQHRLVRAQGSQRLQDGRKRLSFYRFQHNLFQKYLYGSLDEAERMYLHEDIGYFLEALYENQADDIAVQLARHFLEAEVLDKARLYLFKAGIQAVARYANEEAVDYLSRALDVTPKDDLTERYELLLVREKIFSYQGKRDLQRRDLHVLGSLAQQLEDIGKQAEIAYRLAFLAKLTGEHSTARENAEFALRLAQKAQDLRIELLSKLIIGHALWQLGENQAAKLQFEETLLLARQESYPQNEAAALRELGIVSSHTGDYPSAQSFFQQALQVYIEIGDRRNENSMRNNLGRLSVLMGEYKDAELLLLQVLQTARKMGGRLSEADALNNLAEIAYYQGDYALSTEYVREALIIHREVGNRSGEGFVLGNLGDLAMKLGDYDRAQAYFIQALQVGSEIGSQRIEELNLANLSRLLLHMEDNKTSLKYCQQALRVAKEMGDRHVRAYVLCNMGFALAGLGRFNDAEGAFREALAIRGDLGQSNKSVEALAGLAHIFSLQGDQTLAYQYVQEILDKMGNDMSLDGVEDLAQVYLTCYQVLQANHDSRAADVLESAMKYLDGLVKMMDDQYLRKSFWENIHVHRELRSISSTMQSH